MKLFKNSIMLCISFLFCIQYMQCINIRYIKDTYTILKPDYKQLSPAHGPVWWEKDIVRNIFLYGLFGTNPGARKKDGITYPQAPYSTVRLTRMLFHEVQGSFNVTRAPGSPATYFSPRLVGTLLGEIENTRTKVQAVAQSKIKNSKKVIKVNQLQKDLVTQLNKLLTEDATYQSGVSSYYKAIAEKKEVGTLKKYFTRNQTRLINSLVGALEESGFFDIGITQAHLKSPVFYPPYTHYMTLLTFLYRKAENIKNGIEVGKVDYKEYFEGVQQQAAQDIFTESGQNVLKNKAWLKDVYDDSKAGIEKYLSEIKNTVTANTITTNLLDQVYEKMIFTELSRPTEFPDIAAYRKSTYKGHTFPDCQDTLMRNLCNIILLNPKTNMFDIKQLKGAHPTKETASFYTNPLYEKASEVENPLTHDAWNNVVQNQSYISYNRLIRLKDKLQLCCASDKKFTGFMLSTQALQEKATEKIKLTFSDKSADAFNILVMNDKKFVLVDPKRYAIFEIMPSLKNTIILINQLLGLGLYQNIAKVFFKPNFNNTYFPKLAEKLDWQDYEESVEDMDKADYKDISILVTTKVGGSFNFELSSGHGEIVVMSPVEVEPYQETVLSFVYETLKFAALKYQLAQDIFLLNVFALYQNNLFFGSKQLKAFGYYTHRLQYSSIREKIIKHIIDNRDQAMYDLCAVLIISLIEMADLSYLMNVTSQNNLAQFMTGKGGNKKIATALRELVDSIPNLELREGVKVYINLIKQGLFVDEAIKVARKRMISGNDDESSFGRELYAALIREEKIPAKEVIKVALKMMQSNNWDQQVWGMTAVRNFAFINQAYKEAIEAAQIEIAQAAHEAIKGNNLYLTELAFRLFKRLIMEGIAIKEASKAALAGARSEDRWVQRQALEIINQLEEWQNEYPELKLLRAQLLLLKERPLERQFLERQFLERQFYVKEKKILLPD